jgi:transposase-like protein
LCPIIADGLQFRDWEQKRNDERVKFESEQARNKRILKEDGEKLNRELSRNNEVRENVEQTVSLKAELKSVGLDLPTFKAVVIETTQGAGISPGIGRKIKENVKKLGSLYKAIAKGEAEEKSKTRTLQWLDGEIAKRHQTIRRQSEEVETGARLIAEQLKLIEYWKGKVEKSKWQYEFFQLFISMLLTSPSASESVEALGVADSRVLPLTALGLRVQALSGKGWTHSKEGTSEERRAAFIIIVMGMYLHSIHCGNCGASFIVNKPSNAYSSYRSSYDCPVCTFSNYTKPDETFFDLMVSPELTKKFQNARALLDIMGKTDLEALGKKLKLLDLVPNEVYKALSEGRRIEVKVLDGTD